MNSVIKTTILVVVLQEEFPELMVIGVSATQIMLKILDQGVQYLLKKLQMIRKQLF